VDDGSTDASADLAGRHPGVRVSTHAGNRGLSAARNTGIAAAATGFVALLDSDDAWDADKTARQLPAFTARPFDVSYRYAGDLEMSIRLSAARPTSIATSRRSNSARTAWDTTS
jgi:glycosyltransferase involved in cell wall biosynthesis